MNYIDWMFLFGFNLVFVRLFWYRITIHPKNENAPASIFFVRPENPLAKRKNYNNRY
jgi:hypothetical protein